MSPQLAALFAAHKTAILAAGAAGVAGIALLQRKKNAGSSSSTSTTPAGTIPAAGVVSAGGIQGTYPDTSSTDMYNQLEGQLERLQAGSQAVPVPSPIASTLFAPSGSGQYVVYTGDGQIDEVQSDGSLYHLNQPEYAQLVASGVTADNKLDKIAGTPGTTYSYGTNMASKIAAGQKLTS